LPSRPSPAGNWSGRIGGADAWLHQRAWRSKGPLYEYQRTGIFRTTTGEPYPRCPVKDTKPPPYRAPTKGGGESPTLPQLQLFVVQLCPPCGNRPVLGRAYPWPPTLRPAVSTPHGPENAGSIRAPRSRRGDFSPGPPPASVYRAFPHYLLFLPDHARVPLDCLARPDLAFGAGPPTVRKEGPPSLVAKTPLVPRPILEDPSPDPGPTVYTPTPGLTFAPLTVAPRVVKFLFPPSSFQGDLTSGPTWRKLPVLSAFLATGRSDRPGLGPGALEGNYAAHLLARPLLRAVGETGPATPPLVPPEGGNFGRAFWRHPVPSNRVPSPKESCPESACGSHGPSWPCWGRLPDVYRPERLPVPSPRAARHLGRQTLEPG